MPLRNAYVLMGIVHQIINALKSKINEYFEYAKIKTEVKIFGTISIK